MKKMFLSILLIVGFVSIQAGNGFEVKYSQNSPTSSQLEFVLGQFDLKNVNLNGIDFTKILFEGKVTTKDKGYAELPFIHASIQLKPDKNVSLQIISKEFTDYQLDFPLVPSRGVIYRDQDPSQIPYVIDPASVVDKFYPGKITNMVEPFIIKDVRGVSVYVFPFQYNAATNTLRIYNNLVVELIENNSTPVNPLSKTSVKVYREMTGLYKSIFINYDSSKDDLTIAETGDILVITTARDEDAIQPYIDWKMEKGFNVFKEVVATGTDITELVQEQYDANNNILYVLLVGDWADVKVYAPGGTPKDPVVGCVSGPDDYMDICIGRFSANSAVDVTTQVNKIINYEKYPEMGATWYEAATGVASNQGPGDDNEIDYEHLDVIWNNKLDPFTYETYTPIYDPSANATMVTNALEAGTSIINYTGHGSSTSWGTTGFSNSNIAALNNGNKLPFIFSVACYNGTYHSGTCFAEAWMRKEGGGAITAVMATISQPWDPPMRGQDYFCDIITGGYDYSLYPGQSGISTFEGRTTIGSVVFNGLVLMINEAPTTDLLTAQTWITFGDPSMQIRTATPELLTISNNLLLVGTPFETTVNAGGNPIEGALVCLSQDGVYKSAYTDANGNVSIENVFLPGDVHLVITGFNTETKVEEITCVPPDGPYVIFNSVEINDEEGNNNGLLDYGESVKLNLAVKNVGIEQADNVQITISTSDEYVTITDDTENYGNIGVDEVKSVDDAFAIEAANNIPDGHSILFDLVAVGQGTWQSSFTITAYAGVLEYGNFTISDLSGNNNGKLDPGETADIIISILNTGNSEATGVIGELSTSDIYITINTSTMEYGEIIAGEEVQQFFNVTADENTPMGHPAEFGFDITADKDLTASGSFVTVVGQIPVLLLDLDENHNSADKMAMALDEIEMSYELTTSFPDDLNLYSSVFLCLGIYSNNHQLSSAEGQTLADYLNAGGNLYMEGGDTWAYDEQTAVHGMFGLNGVSDGTDDLGTINGISGTFTEGMSFNYSGENNWIDHLEPTGTGVLILENQSPQYGTAVANNAGAYKTVGASHEFGGLDSDRIMLMEAYLDFFGMSPPPITANFTADVTEGCEGFEVTFEDQSLGNIVEWNWIFQGGAPATSTEQNPVVTYSSKGMYDVTLEVSDGQNTHAITKTNFITVDAVPETAGEITGDDEVGIGEVEVYTVDPIDNAESYEWVLTPEVAGTMDVNDNYATITWSNTWTGTAALKVCGVNECGAGAYSEDFEVNVFDYTTIDEINELSFNLYPNPTNGNFTLELNTPGIDNYDVKLVNVLGVAIYKNKIEVNGRYSETLNLTGLSEGIYYMMINNDSENIIRKIVVRK